MADWNCPQCHAQVDPEDRFCPRCGTKLPAADVQSDDVTGVVPIVDDSGPMPAVATENLEDLAPGTAVFLVRKGPGQGTRFVLTGEQLEIGRADEAAVFLDDVTVSRRHAILTHDDQGWTIADAGSLNGTYVNRELVGDVHRLVEGEEVQLGKYRFVYLVAPSDGSGAS